MARAKRTDGQEKPTGSTGPTGSKKRKSTRSVTIQEPLKKSSSNTRKRGTGTTGLTEIIEDLSMLDPGSPMILDTEDPENHGEVRTGSGANEGGKARPRTVNDKLRQARNFLSHEDANRHVDFARRHAKIDKFLQLIAKERADCDVPLYNEVQAMVQVHQSRMNRQKPQITERPDNTSRQSQSDRLSLFDTSKQGHLLGAPLREDHPPFTLERPVDQNLFIKALHGLPAVGQFEASEVKNRRVELQDNEHRGFLDTLKNPSLIHEWIEGRESQTRDERFNARATRRGRRRAAVQMALRSFATNCEQHYEGRWDRSDFRLPAPPVPQKSGEKIVFDKTITAQNDLKKPFSWTHKYQQFLRAQRNRPQGGKDGSLQEFARPLNGNQPISTEKQAMDLLRAEIRKESQENKHRLESTNDKDWASPASKTGVKKPYFSLNRWSGPAPKSTAEKQTQTSETRPENVATPSPLEVGRNSLVQGNSQGQGNSHIQEGSQRDKSLLEIARSQEKLFRGDAAFTFAETPFLQTVKSKFGSGKSRDTKASKHIQLPSIKFSLPEPAYTPKEEAFDPQSGHKHHLRRHVHRQTTKFRTESLPKGNDDKSKISKPRAWVPAKKSTAPLDYTDLSKTFYPGLKNTVSPETESLPKDDDDNSKFSTSRVWVSAKGSTAPFDYFDPSGSFYPGRNNTLNLEELDGVDMDLVEDPTRGGYVLRKR